jgi:hypothetical protein
MHRGYVDQMAMILLSTLFFAVTSKMHSLEDHVTTYGFRGFTPLRCLSLSSTSLSPVVEKR